MECIQFYQGLLKANGRYTFEGIMRWDDFKLEDTHDYIQWLFPDFTGGVIKKNKKKYKGVIPILNEAQIQIFRTDYDIRKKVVTATLRMANFYGYELDVNQGDMKRIKDIKRMKDGKYIGIYSTHNFWRISRILKFLYIIRMEYMSNLFFLMCCQIATEDPHIYREMLLEKSFTAWMYTQRFLINILEYRKGGPLTDKPKLSEKYRTGIPDQPYIPKTYLSLPPPTVIPEIGVGKGKKREETGSTRPTRPPMRKKISVDFNEKKDEEEREKKEEKKERVDENVPVGPVNEKNSCYMDSVLMALFGFKIPIIDHYFFERSVIEISKTSIYCSRDPRKNYEKLRSLRKKLADIVITMRGGEHIPPVNNCGKFRKALGECKLPFNNRKMQDAGEFLIQIFTIFNVNIMLRHRETFGLTDKVIVNTSEHKFFDVPVVNVYNYNFKIGYETQDYLVSSATEILANPFLSNGQSFNVKREKNSVIRSDFLVFYIHRLYKDKGKTFRNIGKITPTQKIRIENRILEFYSVIVHKDAHYTCYIMGKSGVWYLYDDLREGLEEIGSYEKMIESEDKPLRYGNLFFYRLTNDSE